MNKFYELLFKDKSEPVLNSIVKVLDQTPYEISRKDLKIAIISGSNFEKDSKL